MRKYLLAAVAVAAVTSTPALARDGAAYVGVEGGVLFPKDQDADVFVDYTTTNNPSGVAGTPAGPSDTTFDEMFGLDYKRGIDLDAIVGYDFGMFRIEGELGYKKAKLNELEVSDEDIAELNAALNLNQPGGNAPLTAEDFDASGSIKVWSAMLNGLVDFGDEDGLSFYAGGGFGRARVKAAGDKDSAWAWQLIAGARYALSDMVDIGLKYRYFQTGRLNLSEEPFDIAGDPITVFAPGTVPIPVTQTTDATLYPDFEQKFRSHSLLASLIFNLGGSRAAAPPPPPPPPPPATQTCPDGSVILATDACPPPPPPPPPPPEPERG